MRPEFGTMNWYVGQRIVCVNGKFTSHFYEWGDHIPVEGEIYTIRWMGELPNGLTGILGLGFLLGEIVNPSFGRNSEVAFHHSRFKPLTAEEPEVASAELADLFPSR